MNTDNVQWPPTNILVDTYSQIEKKLYSPTVGTVLSAAVVRNFENFLEAISVGN